MFGKINQKLLMDVVIASVIVDVAPDLINKYLFKDKPLTGVTLKAVAGASAFMVGNMLKKPIVANVGLGVAIGDFVSDLVKETLGTNEVVTIPASYQSGKPAEIGGGVSEYLRLNEYIPNSDIAVNRNYENFYSVLN